MPGAGMQGQFGQGQATPAQPTLALPKTGQATLVQPGEALLSEARLEVDEAIQLLVSPSPGSLDRCARILESAGHRIAAFQRQTQPEPGRSEALNRTRANVREEARRLRSSVLRAGRLLEGAASFHFYWGRMRDTLCAGYTRRGEPAPAPPRTRMSFQG
jgi:hypothetical protein